MTKMKSKKMAKSTFAVIIMAIVMVALMAFGGTYAYFTATARHEQIDNIKTAKLELYNKSTKLTYDSTAQIVPGQYIFGTGTYYGDVETNNDAKMKQIDLSLKADQTNGADGDAANGTGTNAAVYAFVRVTTLVYEGASFNPVSSQIVGIKGTGSVGAEDPVLRLFVRTVAPDASGNGQGWQVLETTDSSRSTYIYIFRVADTKEARDLFNQKDFWFALQFDHRVESSRVQDVDPETGESKDTYTEVHNTTSSSGIMDLNIRFSMEFAVVQQLGWDEEAAKWNAKPENKDNQRTPEQMAFFGAFDTVNSEAPGRVENVPLN